VLDTRTGAGGWLGRAAQGQTLTVSTPGVPAGAVVVGNITLTDTVGGGYVTAWSGSGPLPATSNVNHGNGDTRPNMITVAAAGQKFAVAESGSGRSDVIVDITGWFSPSS
jgi:hypothetical protein